MNARTLAPKPIEIDVTFVVRNVAADSFEQAKAIAIDLVHEIRPKHMAFAVYAAKETDGSYTVTFR